ncbi:hypothetical protein [Streptomyces sp. NPDC057545]|uniref:hypothetical protein n=1 Tax=unclassified Streptomyces TaxID=2593676 RepID=UPI0036BD58C0
MNRTPCDTRPYPEPPAHPLWHQHSSHLRPLTAKQQRRNRALLELASRSHRSAAA